MWGQARKYSDVPSLATPHPAEQRSSLIVRDCHERVMHGGVRSQGHNQSFGPDIGLYGEGIVLRILYTIAPYLCRRFQGKSYTSPPRSSTITFAQSQGIGHSLSQELILQALSVCEHGGAKKVWICLYTCCVTRAVYLDLVPDLTAEAFIRCFKRFSARRGFSARMISDNGKTFKAVAKMVRTTVGDSAVTDFFSIRGIQWRFNVERAPWWGGILKRMVQNA